MKLIRVYDNQGETIDRITVVLLNQPQGDMYESIGACETGRTFYQHSLCHDGAHLGKEINFEELTMELQTKLLVMDVYDY